MRSSLLYLHAPLCCVRRSSRRLNTGDRFIQEGNWWGDSFWGVDFKTNTGENNLGLLIMAIREELVKEEQGKSWLRKMAERAMGFFQDILRLS